MTAVAVRCSAWLAAFVNFRTDNKQEHQMNNEDQDQPILGTVDHTARGFEIIEFDDTYGHKCSLQQSSLAEVEQPGWSAVWLGVDDAEPKIMKRDATKHGIELPPGEVSGWMPFPVPDDVQLTTRMHLSHEQVKALIVSLQRWVDCGSFATDEMEAAND